MKQHQVYIIAGSNIHPRKKFIDQSIHLISQLNGLKIDNKSRKYESDPWGFEAAVPFINQAIQLSTTMDAYTLLKKLLAIEQILGRQRTLSGYQSRTIDLDILFFDNDLIQTEDLTIPHPGIPERRFVLEPLHELAADFVHPVSNKTIHTLLYECNDNGKVNPL
ncbi:MAG: 2-amino-4-hydroxy-6-hydroxymethyldihydropteridine diphosphokinase [Bacteroidales bacterium]